MAKKSTFWRTCPDTAPVMPHIIDPYSVQRLINTFRSQLMVLLLLLTSTVMLCAGPAHAAKNLLGGDDPLSPEAAYAPSVSIVDQNFITVTFNIADGYYLYRDKTSINAAQPSNAAVELLDPAFPKALMYEDEFFGTQAIYRNTTDIKVPYRSDGVAHTLELNVKYQGCADIGLCYPPTKALLRVELPASDSSATDSPSTIGKSNWLKDLPSSSSIGEQNGITSTDSTSPIIGIEQSQDLFGASVDQDELLPPERAYLPEITRATTRELSVRWQIKPGYYLYRDKLSFALQNAGGATLVRTYIDEGISQYDEFFGDVQVLRETAEAHMVIDLPEGTQASKLNNATLLIKYQGCADIGVCFPPSKATLPVVFDQADTSTILTDSLGKSPTLTGNITPAENTPAAASTNFNRVAANAPQSEQDRLFDLLGKSSLWLSVVTFFGLGLLLAFTPCVLPMVPILSSLIVGQGDAISTGRAFRLSLVYVLVMASTYAVVGILVGLSGYNIQASFQNPWVLSAIAALFVVLSLSMFGFFELQLPTSVQARLTKWSNKQGGGQMGGVAAMGFISTLIVGPCVTAPLAGALIYIAKTGDAVIGGSALFALGLGMGAPLLLIGASAGKLVPRAGAWMNATKHVFGILMLAMAIYMVSRFLPVTITMALYGILAVMSGVYLGATDTLNRDSHGWQRFGKGAGLVVSLYGLALLVGSLAGGSSYSTPLRGVMSASSGQTQPAEHGLSFVQIKGTEGVAQAVRQANLQGKPVMLDFYADWCISCKEMEAFTFTDERVQALLANTVVIQADVTDNDKLDQALLKQYDLFGPPGIIFYDATGQEIPAARMVGFMSAADFGDHVQRFLGGTAI